MDKNTQYLDDSLNELIKVHQSHLAGIVSIYPSENEIDLLISLFLSIIYEYAAKNDDLHARFVKFNDLLDTLIRKCIDDNLKTENDNYAKKTLRTILKEIPSICHKSYQDVDLAFKEDPAVFCREEIIKCYPFAKSVPVYRLANIISHEGIKILPRMLTEYMHSKTGIDIHPSATIDSPFFIDHGTGVVIGGTATIGKNVKIFHGVTLGAKAFARDSNGMVIKGKKRHPTIKDNVSIYSGAVILGGDTIIESNSVIGGNAWITNSIPKNTMVLVDDKVLQYIRI